MADAETKPTRLQVANLPPGDSGRGVARLPVKLMESLGLVEGAVIEIIGKRSTAARAIRPYGDDAGLDIIRLDGLQRANAGVGSGDFVEIQKAVSKPASRVVFAPAQSNVRLQGSTAALQRSFRVVRSPRATSSPRATNGSMPTCPSMSGNCSTRPPSPCRSAPDGGQYGAARIVHIDQNTQVDKRSDFVEGAGERRADVITTISAG